ncbi:DUF4129 domain-containing protein [Umezawaea endophytica]|uniref:DUF4129 domain-containing protein n=1 Tax=Umezawaea endophytica TaxID=1654476 RepID=A0A9X2VNE5_9PSEU|nr:DUF4129 domain-containing protein [Umezawaea endophytica]MCS7479901.1 DUF4129 domain-containing protein [Umezawaea endophytica]
MRTRWLVPLLAGAALVLVALAARGNSPIVYDGTLQAPDVPAAETAAAAEDSAAEGVVGVVGGSLVALLVVVLCVLVVLSLGAVVLMLGPHRKRVRAEASSVVAAAADDEDGRLGTEVLLTGARKALAELRGRPTGPPSDAVVAAWLNLEQAAASSGAPRRDHETPTEFTGALLTRYEVDTAAAATLRGLYQRARFGAPDQVTTRDAEAAADALERVVACLDRP